ncbi:MAG: glycosyltransferase family protein [Spirosomataceae bacterium]
MRFLFVIQGEGRGHQTQAIALAQLLQKEGHEIKALVGVPDGETLPTLLAQESSFPCQTFKSPNLVYDQKTNALSIRKTIFSNVRAFPVYLQSIQKIEAIVQSFSPDSIINFYDVLIGIHQFIYKRKHIPFLCIGHQYLLLHEDFPHPKTKKWANFLLSTHTRLTCFRADKLLGLSLKPYPKSKKVHHFVSVPPLIRSAVLQLKPTHRKPPFLLVYLTQLVDIEPIVNLHLIESKFEIHLFVGKNLRDQLEKRTLPFGIYLHDIHPLHFLEKMSQCAGLVTTAGFESIAEAMYLQKSVLAIPIAGHYEQMCNAIDAEQSGAGLHLEKADISSFLTYLSTQKPSPDFYQTWVKKSQEIMLHELITAQNNTQVFPKELVGYQR